MNYELLIQEIQAENEYQIQQWQKEMMECTSTDTTNTNTASTPKAKDNE